MHSHLKVKCALYDDFKKFLHHQTTLQPVSEASITAVRGSQIYKVKHRIINKSLL